MARMAATLTVLLLLGCNEYRPTRYEPETVVLRGNFVLGGLEVGDKIEIGSGESICFDAPPALRATLPRTGQPTAIVAEGNLTRPGRYGHLGLDCTRRFRVTRLLESRPMTETEFNSLRIADTARQELSE